MDKVTIQLTKQQHTNLFAFLNRVNLTGAEVQAFVEVMTALSIPIVEKENKEEGVKQG